MDAETKSGNVIKAEVYLYMFIATDYGDLWLIFKTILLLPSPLILLYFDPSPIVPQSAKCPQYLLISNVDTIGVRRL